jgi:non-homologous end joining protein Ku
MAEQFVNPEETKLEDETVSDSTAQKHIQRIAEKAAQKSVIVPAASECRR